MKGEATVEKFDEKSIVKEYTKAIRGLAEEYGVCFFAFAGKVGQKICGICAKMLAVG